MKIRYRVTKDVRDVDDRVARELIDRHLADAVPSEAPVNTRAIKAEDAVVPHAGKPKRRYTRRDMRAEG